LDDAASFGDWVFSTMKFETLSPVFIDPILAVLGQLLLSADRSHSCIIPLAVVTNYGIPLGMPALLTKRSDAFSFLNQPSCESLPI
jgi:hypothetical protein